jgi:hypothetical protein
LVLPHSKMIKTIDCVAELSGQFQSGSFWRQLWSKYSFVVQPLPPELLFCTSLKMNCD